MTESARIDDENVSDRGAIDLDENDVRSADGTRLTEARADELAVEFLEQAIGAFGDFDVILVVERSRELAERLHNGRHRVLAGMAHLPQPAGPATVASVISAALAVD